MAIDTNVAVVANGLHRPAGNACVEACIGALRDARKGIVLIGDGGRILQEYRRRLSGSGGPHVGDAFFKWLWDNQGNRQLCRQVRITPADDGNFLEFPQDARLEKFDPDDRKFVAVVLASECPGKSWVLNASDSDWWEFRGHLGEAGVQIEFLCPELMLNR